MTYCRGYLSGIEGVRKTRLVPIRCGAQRFLPHLSAIPLQSCHFLALLGLPRQRLSLLTQGSLVHGSPSHLLL